MGVGDTWNYNIILVNVVINDVYKWLRIKVYENIEEKYFIYCDVF